MNKRRRHARTRWTILKWVRNFRERWDLTPKVSCTYEPSPTTKRETDPWDKRPLTST